MTTRPCATPFIPAHAGLVHAGLARLLEVPRETIDGWLAQVSEFAAAVKAGRDIADATVAERLYARVIGYSHEAKKIYNNKGEIVRRRERHRALSTRRVGLHLLRIVIPLCSATKLLSIMPSTENNSHNSQLIFERTNSPK